MSFARYKFLWLPLALLLPVCASAQANWTAPTADELTMTSEPKAPGASVIILSCEEKDEADSYEVTLHVRLKVLTEGGLSAGTITLPELADSSNGLYQEIYARTIHRDGTIIPFTDTPHNSVVAGEGKQERIISLPGVEVGSILEYIYHFYIRSTVISRLGFYSPFWVVQRNYFIRSAHFSLKPPSNLDQKYVRWVANLPPKTAPHFVKNSIVLDLNDIPAIPDEELAPPKSSTFYNVRFFYYDDTREKYWGTSGDRVDFAWSRYDEPRKELVTAVQTLVQPSDTDEQKLHKIYSAVMQFENTDFTRAHQQEEDKKNGLRRIQNSEDLWLAKRGDSYELTLLFVALARAAGFPAYPMAVASRNEAVFDQNVLSWSQLDSMVAIVNVKGKEIFFDPGTRLCPFAHMAPWHANVIGVSSEGKLIKIRYTPSESYKSSQTQRTADLVVASDGTVTGTAKITLLGTAGLALRQTALRNDPEQAKGQLEKTMRQQAPTGIQLKLTKLDGLDNGDEPLIATFAVTGNLGTATKTRLILPSQFFEASSKPLLSSSTRTLPVAFPNAYSIRDIVTLHLPANFSVEALPGPANFSLHSDDITYKNAAQSGTMTAGSSEIKTPAVIVQRVLVLNKIDYAVSDYTELHSYLGQAASSDQEQIILHASSSESQGR